MHERQPAGGKAFWHSLPGRSNQVEVGNGMQQRSGQLVPDSRRLQIATIWGSLPLGSVEFA
jgi:hypothetical protein